MTALLYLDDSLRGRHYNQTTDFAQSFSKRKFSISSISEPKTKLQFQITITIKFVLKKVCYI